MDERVSIQAHGLLVLNDYLLPHVPPRQDIIIFIQHLCISHSSRRWEMARRTRAVCRLGHLNISNEGFFLINQSQPKAQFSSNEAVIHASIHADSLSLELSRK